MDGLYNVGDKVFYQGYPVTVREDYCDDGFDYLVDAGRNDIFGCDEKTLSKTKQSTPEHGW